MSLVSFNLSVSTVAFIPGADIDNTKPAYGPGSDNTPRSTFGPMNSPLLHIEELISFEGEAPTDIFLSGSNMIVKCKANHTNGSEYIIGANITMVKIGDDFPLVQKTAMAILDPGTDKDWKWFQFSQTLPVPSPRGFYNITVEITGNTTEASTELITTEATVKVEVLNSLPNIVGKIG
ncbi:hypothetical protein, partial [[Eubacterium] cellulosolvens]